MLELQFKKGSTLTFLGHLLQYRTCNSGISKGSSKVRAYGSLTERCCQENSDTSQELLRMLFLCSHSYLSAVFNLRRLNSKPRTSKVLINDLFFADDCVLLAHTVDDIQAITNPFVRSARCFGLTISLKKREVIYQPKPGADYTAPTITIDNNALNVVDKVTCLGSTISQNALIDDEISARTGKASGSFGKLTKRLWSERGVRLATKINVYCASCMGARHVHHTADTYEDSTSSTRVA